MNKFIHFSIAMVLFISLVSSCRKREFTYSYYIANTSDTATFNFDVQTIENNGTASMTMFSIPHSYTSIYSKKTTSSNLSDIEHDSIISILKSLKIYRNNTSVKLNPLKTINWKYHKLSNSSASYCLVIEDKCFMSCK